MKSRKTRVLHVLKSSVYSGAENVVISIINNLLEEYEFAYVSSNGPIKNVLEKYHINHYLLDKFNINALRCVVKSYNPDIIHSHDFTASVLCANLHGNFRLISHLHYDPPWTKKWNIKTFVYCICGLLKIDKVLVVSEKTYKAFSFSNLIKYKYVVVNNPIDIRNIRHRGLEQSLDCQYDLIFVGRLVEQKNPQRFINIVKLLNKRGLNLKCVMLGSGDLDKECKEMIKKEGLQDNIDLLGFKRNPYVYMNASKILCMTSKWEGYGLVLLEANCQGIPVLSTKTSGAMDVLGDDAIELCNTDEEFIQKIERLITDSVEYTKWSQKSIDRVNGILPLETYMDQIRGIYDELN